jgi:hypothetical protein
MVDKVLLPLAHLNVGLGVVSVLLPIPSCVNIKVNVYPVEVKAVLILILPPSVIV